MTTQEIINCAPWRGQALRPLTNYEWTVVDNAIYNGIISAGTMPLATVRGATTALTGAIRMQAACPSWSHSAFGPAPAVATYAYGCLASWWGALDPASQTLALADIRAGLLCAPQVPWAHCPRAQKDILWRPTSQSEYGAQMGTMPPGVAVSDPCAFIRARTVYTPMTGQELQELMKLLGGGFVPPQMAELIKLGGQLFANTSFLVGWQMRDRVTMAEFPTSLDPQSLMRFADAILEDVAVITAPGQGVSIRDMVVTGTMDPAKLIVILQQLNPEAWGDLWQNLPGWVQQNLPGLLQVLPQIDLGGIFGALGGIATQQQLVQSANLPNNTGYDVVDKPASEQKGEASSIFGVVDDRIYWFWVATAVIVGGALLVAARR